MWRSSDSNVASVTKNGKVTAKDQGSCTITATVGSGSGSIKLQCKIYVKSRLNASSTLIYCPMDEFQEIQITMKNPKKNEFLSYSINSSSHVEIELGENRDNTTTVYISPLSKGTTTITFNIVSSESNLSYTLSNPLEITICVGISVMDEWISKKTLNEVFDIYVIEGEYLEIMYEKGLYSAKSINLTPPQEIEIGKEYKSKNIRFKYKSKNEILYNVTDLRTESIIK